ncbi:VapC toxin family PIN domain ribonuclease [Halobacteriales archaeon QS_4_69_34]|nr:MAG: VapC toxin family PIN domain ribonuclease [Halobacteriales archaeon QS_4_69_34]
MKAFVDTNVFVAAVTDEPDRGVAATTFLDADHEFQTSLLNLMELRSILSKKKRRERDRIEALERRILGYVDLVVPDTADMVAADDLQRETFLYPIDCLILACAREQGSTLVSFDGELVDAGAVSPEELTD